MDDDTSFTDDPRVPLITLTEVREAVVLLLHLSEQDTEEGHRAGQLASDLALRLPEPA
ncbi:hypothetical protein ACFC0K_15725 [Streptomyces hydrogenans]|uniref:hypothetical protein n=1 Tax=Streptomyces hydrogenans TaxID=1873719 RepID=UPI0035E37FE6